MAAVLLVAAAGTALAAPSAMPDSPLYPVKQLEESLLLATTPAASRLTVQLALANERLREAQVMAANHKPRLAADSVRAFQVILNDSAAAVRHRADPSTAREKLGALRAALNAVERQNVTKDDDDGDLRQEVLSSLDDLDRIESADDPAPGSTLIIGTQSTPLPTPTPKPQPAVKPTPLPEPSDDEHHH
jgi:hypothetical protein